MTRALFAIAVLSTVMIGCQRGNVPGPFPSGGSPASTTSLPAPAADGHVVSNGGSFMEGLFQQGRLHAVRVLSRLTWNDVYVLPYRYLTDSEFKWLIDNREKLAKDIAGVEHRFVDELPADECPEDGCACAPPSQPHRILLSRRMCTSFRRIPQAAELLAHESLHHFYGDNERKVVRLASALYGIWLGWNHQEEAHWTRMASPPRKIASYAGAVWTGKVMVVFDGTGSVLTYDPVWDKWIERFPINYAEFDSYFSLDITSWFKVRVNEVSPYYFSLSSGEGFFKPGDPNTKSDGLFLRQNQWIPLDVPGRLSSRRGPLKSVIGDELFLWGGTPRNSTAWDATGWRYRGSNNEWRAMRPFPFPCLPSADGDMQAIATDKEIIQWSSHPGCTSAIYSPRSDTWRKISSHNAPGTRRNASAVWTDAGLVIYGGSSYQVPSLFSRDPFLVQNNVLNPELRFEPDGGLYDPERDKWKNISIQGAPRPTGDQPIPAVWTGTHVIFATDRLYLYEPWKDDWSPSGAQLDPISPGSTLLWTGTELISWSPMVGGYIYHP